MSEDVETFANDCAENIVRQTSKVAKSGGLDVEHHDINIEQSIQCPGSEVLNTIIALTNQYKQNTYVIELDSDMYNRVVDYVKYLNPECSEGCFVWYDYSRLSTEYTGKPPYCYIRFKKHVVLDKYGKYEWDTSDWGSFIRWREHDVVRVYHLKLNDVPAVNKEFGFGVYDFYDGYRRGTGYGCKFNEDGKLVSVIDVPDGYCNGR